MSQSDFRASDKRTLKRWHLVLYLRVHDQDRDVLLGHVVDINTEGMMIISDQPFPAGRRYNLCIEFPRDEGGTERVCVAARSVWSNRDVNPDFYDNGLRLTQIGEEARFCIEQIIDDFNLYA